MLSAFLKFIAKVPILPQPKTLSRNQVIHNNQKRFMNLHEKVYKKILHKSDIYTFDLLDLEDHRIILDAMTLAVH